MNRDTTNQAIQNYQRVLELDPDNSKANYWLKEAQRQLESGK